MQNSCRKDNVTTSKSGGKELTKKLVLTAAFTALAIVANAFLTLRFSTFFKFSPVLVIYFFAGYYLGIFPAVCVGALGDFLGWLVFPDGAFNPLIALANALCCLIPALLFRLAPSKKTGFLRFAILSGISYLLSYVFCTVFLTSLGIWLYTDSIRGKYETLVAWFLYRAAVQILNSLSNYAVTLALFFPLKKIKPLSR